MYRVSIWQVKMRFLFVLNICFDLPGPSVHLLKSVIDCGVKLGHQIDVILKKSNQGELQSQDNTENGANYYYISETPVNKNNFIKRYLEEKKYASEVYNSIDKNVKYDAVFLQSTNAAVFYVTLLKKIKAPILFNVQDIFPYNLHYSGQMPFDFLSFKVFRFLQNQAYKKVDSIVTISPDMKNTLVSDGVDSKKIKCIYNWSYSDELVSLDNLSNINNYIIDNNKYNVVYAGNIGKMQNVEVIAETASYLKNEKDIMIYIIGNGSNLPKIKEKYSNCSNIVFLSPVASKYAESIYAQADINVIPLSKYGVKTALPSKTATCLRTEKSVLFCFDENSEFQKELSQLEGVYFCEIEAKALAEKIKDIKDNKNKKFNRITFIKDKMSSSTNPFLYIKEMESFSKNM